MGAVAITTLAGSTLLLARERWPLLAELAPFLNGFTLFFWAAGTWWIPLLLLLGVWRHVWRRHPLRYDPQYWGMVFPLGMYTVATWRLAEALPFAPLATIARVFLPVALLAWLLAAAGLVGSWWQAWRGEHARLRHSMTSDILLLLVLLAGAVIFFATEWIAPELTAGAAAPGLDARRSAASRPGFRGIRQRRRPLLGSVFVIGQALVRTGVLYGIERSLARAGERIPRRVLPILVLSTAALSSFLSNTATVAAMLPVASGLARRLRLSPSRIYMPLAFAAILGGSLTLIGTSTNIVVAAAMPGLGEPSWGLFELTPAALPAVALGLVYLLTVGRRLLPERAGEVADLYRLREYVSEVVVPAGSPWVHRTLNETRAGADLEITVLGRIEQGAVEPLPPDAQLAAGDRLLVKANHQALLRIKARRELDLVVDRDGEPSSSRAPAAHEVVLPHGSRLSGRTLRSLSFGTRYRAMVIALFRGGEPVLDRVAGVTLRDGDVLLIQGDLEPLGELFNGGHLLLLEETPIPVAGVRSWLAVGSFVAMLVVGGLGWLPFPLAAFATAITVLLARCMTPRQAFQSIDWGVLVLVGSLLGLGAAMEATGAGAIPRRRSGGRREESRTARSLERLLPAHRSFDTANVE